jgi:maleamate amidohydrolase
MSEANYAQAGYGTMEVGRGTRPAIIVVDFQTAFTDPQYPIGGLPMIHAAVERTATLLKHARMLSVPVAKCYTAYGSDADMPRWKVKTVREQFIYGHPCTAIEPKVDAPSDFNFCKNAPSIFFQTPLITFLAKHQVDTVIVTGCTTSGCVRASVIDAFSYGFRVLVAEDCCGDADRGPHEDNLRDISRRYADVLSADEVEVWLSSLAV